MENDFSGLVAERYDRDSADMFTPEVLDPTVEYLAERAAGRPVLEFAIGTGRVAVPLAERGLAVHGIEYSPDMVAQLRAKPLGRDLPVVVGDMSTATAGEPGTFGLVYLVFNTIMNLTSQEAQIACFANAARHLAPGGHFVVEVLIPNLRTLPPGMNTRVFHASEEHVGFDEYTDLAAQEMRSHHHWIDDGEIVQRDVTPFRFVWPSELDLMARLAGMTLRERHEDWSGTELGHDSARHVSTWTKTPR